MADTANEARKALKTHINPEKAAFYPTFFRTGKGEYGEGDKFLGVTVPNVRKVAKQFKELSQVQIHKLLASKWHEERMLALVILVDQFQRGDATRQKEVYDYYLASTAHVNNWDLVDVSAHKIVGPYLVARSRKPLYRLARSKNLWEKRIAMIATLHFIKNDDFADALAVADILKDDSHDLIHKAVGWMLREVGNRDRKTEETFLKPRYRSMPRTMLRYAIEKFPDPLRKRYLEGRI